MAARDSRYFLPRQFENPLNAEDHEHSTGPEIIRQIPTEEVVRIADALAQLQGLFVNQTA